MSCSKAIFNNKYVNYSVFFVLHVNIIYVVDVILMDFLQIHSICKNIIYFNSVLKWQCFFSWVNFSVFVFNSFTVFLCYYYNKSVNLFYLVTECFYLVNLNKAVTFIYANFVVLVL